MKNKRLGIGLIVFGVVGVLALLMISNRVSNAAINHFGRVNVGCQVTFTFPSAGTYFVYVEQGKSRQHNNGCEPSTRGDALSITVTKDGAPVELTPDTSVSYDSDGIVGRSQSRFEVEADSRFQVTVTGPDSAPSVAMGINPVNARRPWRLAAGLVGAVGVIGGIAVLVNRQRAIAAGRDDDEFDELPLAPLPPESPDDITSPTGITVRRPNKRSKAPSPSRSDAPFSTNPASTNPASTNRASTNPENKPPYLPASAVAAVEARRRASAVAGGPSRDRTPSAELDRERTMNTAESPIVPAVRPTPTAAPNAARDSEPPKSPKRGGAVVSSGSSRRRPVAEKVPGKNEEIDRGRPVPHAHSRTPAPAPQPVRQDPPPIDVSRRDIHGASVTSTPPDAVETVGDVLGDIPGATPPTGTSRPPDRPSIPAVQRVQRQRKKSLSEPAPQRMPKKRPPTQPVDRPTSTPAVAQRRMRPGAGLDGGASRARRRPVVGDFLDDVTVGDVLDDPDGFIDPPSRRRGRSGGGSDDVALYGGHTGQRGRVRQPSRRRRDDELADRIYVDDDFDDQYDDGYDPDDGYDGYDEGYRRSGYDGFAERSDRARPSGRRNARPRPSARPRPDRGPEPMREWGTERAVGDDDMFVDFDDHRATDSSVVPPPPPPIRMPPPLPEPDGANGDAPTSVEDEWHDAGDDTGAWRWWSPPDPRNRR